MALTLQPYNIRKAPAVYNDGWFNTEHQNIQRAVAATKRLISYNTTLDGLFTGDSATDDGTKLNTLTNVTMQPAGGQLDVVGIPRIASNVSIPANVTLNPVGGGYLAPDLGVTLTVNSPPTPTLRKIFGGAGTVLFGVGAVAEAYPEWFGAKADTNVTDNAPPFQKCADSMPWGGAMRVLAGKRMFLNEVTLHSGLRVEGQNDQSDNVYGAPPAYSVVQTYCWQATANKAVFVIAGGMSKAIVRYIAFNDRVTPSPVDNPPGAGKIGIKIEGTYGMYVWDLLFEGCLFYTLDRGISCVDTLSGIISAPHPFDWSVAPWVVRQCEFRRTGYGIYIDSNNCDQLLVDTCLWPDIAANTAGIYLYRFGLFRAVNSGGGGSVAVNNSWLQIEGHISLGADTVTLVNCGAESCAHLVNLTATGDYSATAPFTFILTMTDCWNWGGADVSLNNAVQFVSRNNHWSADVKLAHAQAFMSSYDDWFDGAPAHIVFSGGATRANLRTYMPSPIPDTNIPGTIVNGHMEEWGAAAPVAGAHLINDKVWNNAPAAGAPAGWVCSASGTPGTWKAMANLA